MLAPLPCMAYMDVHGSEAPRTNTIRTGHRCRKEWRHMTTAKQVLDHIKKLERIAMLPPKKQAQALGLKR